MPLKKEARDLLNNRFFHLLKEEFETEYFERWAEAETVAGREDIYLEYKAFKVFIARIEHEADSFEPPKEVA